MKSSRPVLFLLACFAAFMGIGWVLPRLLAERRGPCLECSSEVDLGECEAGEMVTRPFPIRNSGDRPLHLQAIRSTCGCAGISRQVDGGFERLVDVVIPPGATEHLFLRVRVSAVKEASGSVHIFFFTNDPSRPEEKVSVYLRRVRAAVELRPPDLKLGRLDPGRIHRFTVEVFDDPKYQRSITKLQSNLPDCVRARFVALEPVAAAEDAAGSVMRLGKVEVEVEGEQPAELLGEIILLSSDETKAPIHLAVSGSIRPWLEFHPARLFLPRRASEGLVSQTTVVCRFPTGVSGTVTVGPSPAGMHVSADPLGELWHVKVQLDLEKAGPGEELVIPLRWHASGRSGEEQLRVQINSAYAK